MEKEEWDESESSRPFRPRPYVFKGTENGPRLSAPVPGPGLHLLLDHLLAVTWILFRNPYNSGLGLGELRWALELVRRVTDSREEGCIEKLPNLSHLSDLLDEALVNDHPLLLGPPPPYPSLLVLDSSRRKEFDYLNESGIARQEDIAKKEYEPSKTNTRRLMFSEDQKQIMKRVQTPEGNSPTRENNGGKKEITAGIFFVPKDEISQIVKKTKKRHESGSDSRGNSDSEFEVMYPRRKQNRNRKKYGDEERNDGTRKKAGSHFDAVGGEMFPKTDPIEKPDEESLIRRVMKYRLDPTDIRKMEMFHRRALPDGSPFDVNGTSRGVTNGGVGKHRDEERDEWDDELKIIRQKCTGLRNKSRYECPEKLEMDKPERLESRKAFHRLHLRRSVRDSSSSEDEEIRKTSKKRYEGRGHSSEDEVGTKKWKRISRGDSEEEGGKKKTNRKDKITSGDEGSKIKRNNKDKNETKNKIVVTERTEKIRGDSDVGIGKYFEGKNKEETTRIIQKRRFSSDGMESFDERYLRTVTSRSNRLPNYKREKKESINKAGVKKNKTMYDRNNLLKKYRRRYECLKNELWLEQSRKLILQLRKLQENTRTYKEPRGREGRRNGNYSENEGNRRKIKITNTKRSKSDSNVGGGKNKRKDSDSGEVGVDIMTSDSSTPDFENAEKKRKDRNILRSNLEGGRYLKRTWETDNFVKHGSDESRTLATPDPDGRRRGEKYMIDALKRNTWLSRCSPREEEKNRNRGECYEWAKNQKTIRRRCENAIKEGWRLQSGKLILQEKMLEGSWPISLEARALSPLSPDQKGWSGRKDSGVRRNEKKNVKSDPEDQGSEWNMEVKLSSSDNESRKAKQNKKKEEKVYEERVRENPFEMRHTTKDERIQSFFDFYQSLGLVDLQINHKMYSNDEENPCREVSRNVLPDEGERKKKKKKECWSSYVALESSLKTPENCNSESEGEGNIKKKRKVEIQNTPSVEEYDEFSGKTRDKRFLESDSEREETKPDSDKTPSMGKRKYKKAIQIEYRDLENKRRDRESNSESEDDAGKKGNKSVTKASEEERIKSSDNDSGTKSRKKHGHDKNTGTAKTELDDMDRKKKSEKRKKFTEYVNKMSCCRCSSKPKSQQSGRKDKCEEFNKELKKIREESEKLTPEEWNEYYEYLILQLKKLEDCRPEYHKNPALESNADTKNKRNSKSERKSEETEKSKKNGKKKCKCDSEGEDVKMKDSTMSKKDSGCEEIKKNKKYQSDSQTKEVKNKDTITCQSDYECEEGKIKNMKTMNDPEGEEGKKNKKTKSDSEGEEGKKKVKKKTKSDSEGEEGREKNRNKTKSDSEGEEGKKNKETKSDSEGEEGKEKNRKKTKSDFEGEEGKKNKKIKSDSEGEVGKKNKNTKSDSEGEVGKKNKKTKSESEGEEGKKKNRRKAKSDSEGEEGKKKKKTKSDSEGEEGKKKNKKIISDSGDNERNKEKLKGKYESDHEGTGSWKEEMREKIQGVDCYLECFESTAPLKKEDSKNKSSLKFEKNDKTHESKKVKRDCAFATRKELTDCVSRLWEDRDRLKEKEYDEKIEKGLNEMRQMCENLKKEIEERYKILSPSGSMPYKTVASRRGVHLGETWEFYEVEKTDSEKEFVADEEYEEGPEESEEDEEELKNKLAVEFSFFLQNLFRVPPQMMAHMQRMEYAKKEKVKEDREKKTVDGGRNERSLMVDRRAPEDTMKPRLAGGGTSVGRHPQCIPSVEKIVKYLQCVKEDRQKKTSCDRKELQELDRLVAEVIKMLKKNDV